jgi:hypothetical protein
VEPLVPKETTMAKLDLTVDDAALAAVDAIWQARGYADLAARLQEFADDEVAAAQIQAQQAVVAAEQAKAVPDDSTIESALKAEYDLRLARDAAAKAATADREATIAAMAAEV